MKLALFDLDGTLLPIDSDHAFGEFMVRLGWADAEGFRRANDRFYAQYQAERLDVHAYIDFATSVWRGRAPQELDEVRERFVREIIAPSLHTSALALVRRHAEAGDQLAIVTATNEFVTQPIAALFGVQHLIATELQRDAAGRFSGKVRGVPSYREGKVERVRQWLQQQGWRRADISAITVYSDSTNDLALLEQATHPVATNPSPALERIAAERGWPILKLFA